MPTTELSALVQRIGFFPDRQQCINWLSVEVANLLDDGRSLQSIERHWPRIRQAILDSHGYGLEE